MERSRFASGMMAFFVFLVLVVSVLTMSLCLGIKRSVKNAVYGAGGDAVQAVADAQDTTTSENTDIPKAIFSAILSEGQIYIYDVYGKLYGTVNAHMEFLTESDRVLLSDGVDFYTEEELRSFVNDFEE
ncbi:MAG: hypothetical protein E7608_03805 [Ruminococcaceae bacterium]|nr:hypothetical protein [Oscillospiraceae bacterium]